MANVAAGEVTLVPPEGEPPIVCCLFAPLHLEQQCGHFKFRRAAIVFSETHIGPSPSPSSKLRYQCKSTDFILHEDIALDAKCLQMRCEK